MGEWMGSGWVEELDGIGHWVDVAGWNVGGRCGLEHVEYIHAYTCVMIRPGFQRSHADRVVAPKM